VAVAVEVWPVDPVKQTSMAVWALAVHAAEVVTSVSMKYVGWDSLDGHDGMETAQPSVERSGTTQLSVERSAGPA